MRRHYPELGRKNEKRWIGTCTRQYENMVPWAGRSHFTMSPEALNIFDLLTSYREFSWLSKYKGLMRRHYPELDQKNEKRRMGTCPRQYENIGPLTGRSHLTMSPEALNNFEL